MLRPDPDVRGTVYNLGVERGTREDWDFVYEAYLNEKVASEKVKYSLLSLTVIVSRHSESINESISIKSRR